MARARRRRYIGRQRSSSGCGIRVIVGPRRAESGGSVRRAVPVPGPHAVLGLRAGGPVEHGVGVGDVQAPAQLGEDGGRVLQHLGGVEHDRVVAGRLDPVEDRHLHREPGGLDSRIRDIGLQGREHAGRMAGEEDVGERVEEPEVEVDEVVCHVLGEPDRPVTVGGEHGVDHPPRVGLHRFEHVVPSGVVQPGVRQVVAVQRLVDHLGVRSLPERVHERRRQVARSRPHRHVLLHRLGPEARSSAAR